MKTIKTILGSAAELREELKRQLIDYEKDDQRSDNLIEEAQLAAYKKKLSIVRNEFDWIRANGLKFGEKTIIIAPASKGVRIVSPPFYRQAVVYFPPYLVMNGFASLLRELLYSPITIGYALTLGIREKVGYEFLKPVMYTGLKTKQFNHRFVKGSVMEVTVKRGEDILFQFIFSGIYKYSEDWHSKRTVPVRLGVGRLKDFVRRFLVSSSLQRAYSILFGADIDVKEETGRRRLYGDCFIFNNITMNNGILKLEKDRYFLCLRFYFQTKYLYFFPGFYTKYYCDPVVPSLVYSLIGDNGDS